MIRIAFKELFVNTMKNLPEKINKYANMQICKKAFAYSLIGLLVFIGIIGVFSSSPVFATDLSNIVTLSPIGRILIVFTAMVILKSNLSLFRAQSGIFKVKSLSQNISIGEINENSEYTDGYKEKKQSLINISESKIHNSSTFPANFNPNLAQPINNVNPITNVANDPIVTAGFAGSKNFKINDASINLDRSSHKSDNFFSSYSDRNGFSSFAIQRYTVKSN